MLNKKQYKTFDLLGIALKVSPLWTGLLLVTQLIGAFVPALLVLTMTNFINRALLVVETGMGELLLPMLSLIGVVSYQWLIHDIQKLFHSRILIATRNTYEWELIQKQASLEYRYLEDGDTYDLIKRISDESEQQPLRMFLDTMGLVRSLINTVSIALILLVNIWWAALAILAFAVPIFYISLKAGKSNYKAQQDVSKNLRLSQYLSEISTGRDTALERTVFGYFPKTIEKLDEQLLYANTIRAQVSWKNFSRQGIGGVAVSLISVFVMVMLLQPVASGALTVGLFISLVNACINLTVALSWELTLQTNQFAKHQAFLKDLTKFCALEETAEALLEKSKTVPTFEKLQLRNVSFTYPNTDKPILNGVNMTLEAGKHYAFVGENGAGKSTIVKLLTAQFTDYSGEILLNGKELKTYSPGELKSFFGVAYQDFGRYALTLKENISLGNLEGSHEELTSAIQDLELEGLIGSLSQGLDTPLGKVKSDGVDLSGGQWQRLALARTMVNPAPLVILDEPTSALDPLSESRLYAQFERMIKGKTSIFISHRLGSIKLADEIFVFKSGTVTEVGTHSKLMDRGGIYQNMYESQLAWYQEEVRSA